MPNPTLHTDLARVGELDELIELGGTGRTLDELGIDKLTGIDELSGIAGLSIGVLLAELSIDTHLLCTLMPGPPGLAAPLHLLEGALAPGPVMGQGTSAVALHSSMRCPTFLHRKQ